MSRKIEIAFQGNIFQVALHRVDRSRLYGSSHRIGLDAKGRECATALLTHDGRHVLGPGSTAGMYLDRDGDVVAKNDLIPTDAQGVPMEILSPTMSTPQELSGPVSAEALLECVVAAVYAVDASELDSTLSAALSRGDIFHLADKGFLLANEYGVFLLATKQERFDFIGRDRQIVFEEDDDNEYDDLGFETM